MGQDIPISFFLIVASIHCFTPFNCIVIPEPQTGFHIAFKMLDIDGNEHVDKKEFQKVWHVLSHLFSHTQIDNKCKCEKKNTTWIKKGF